MALVADVAAEHSSSDDCRSDDDGPTISHTADQPPSATDSNPLTQVGHVGSAGDVEEKVKERQKADAARALDEALSGHGTANASHKPTLRRRPPKLGAKPTPPVAAETAVKSSEASAPASALPPLHPNANSSQEPVPTLVEPTSSSPNANRSSTPRSGQGSGQNTPRRAHSTKRRRISGSVVTELSVLVADEIAADAQLKEELYDLMSSEASFGGDGGANQSGAVVAEKMSSKLSTMQFAHCTAASPVAAASPSDAATGDGTTFGPLMVSTIDDGSEEPLTAAERILMKVTRSPKLRELALRTTLERFKKPSHSRGGSRCASPTREGDDDGRENASPSPVVIDSGPMTSEALEEAIADLSEKKQVVFGEIVQELTKSASALVHLHVNTTTRNYCEQFIEVVSTQATGEEHDRLVVELEENEQRRRYINIPLTELLEGETLHSEERAAKNRILARERASAKETLLREHENQREGLFGEEDYARECLHFEEYDETTALYEQQRVDLNTIIANTTAAQFEAQRHQLQCAEANRRSRIIAKVEAVFVDMIPLLADEDSSWTRILSAHRLEKGAIETLWRLAHLAILEERHRAQQHALAHSEAELRERLELEAEVWRVASSPLVEEDAEWSMLMAQHRTVLYTGSVGVRPTVCFNHFIPQSSESVYFYQMIDVERLEVMDAAAKDLQDTMRALGYSKNTGSLTTATTAFVEAVPQVQRPQLSTSAKPVRFKVFVSSGTESGALNAQRSLHTAIQSRDIGLFSRASEVYYRFATRPHMVDESYNNCESWKSSRGQLYSPLQENASRTAAMNVATERVEGHVRIVNNEMPSRRWDPERSSSSTTTAPFVTHHTNPSSPLKVPPLQSVVLDHKISVSSSFAPRTNTATVVEGRVSVPAPRNSIERRHEERSLSRQHGDVFPAPVASQIQGYVNVYRDTGVRALPPSSSSRSSSAVYVDGYGVSHGPGPAAHRGYY